ncbi:MAG: SAM-dependent DNA methyltransferase [Ignavibacteriae bacterium]|nr:SAM-dependent DNA methyltransferase [Ignavibacteriota bacterium]
MTTKSLFTLIWDIANYLRHDYKQADYGKVILPMTVLRRLDCVLEPTKAQILELSKANKGKNDSVLDLIITNKIKIKFFNKSKYDFQKLLKDPDHIAANLNNFINGFSSNAREILEYFSFQEHIARLDEANLLFLIVKEFAKVDLNPEQVSSIQMGYIFEDLIRRFSELSNETAGEHFTPREVIRLMVNILFNYDDEALTKAGIVRTLYDPACGTGGMLSIAEDHLRDMNEEARLEVFGQEINPESYAICKSDMLIKGQNVTNIKFGNSFTVDGLPDAKFDYLLSNPPFGVEWKKVEKQIRDEHEKRGYSGRFGAGLPRISDGSFLFLQHMISKMKEENGGSRIAIVFNGSPLFAGGAGSGESEIRKWIIEHDWLEAIIALPNDMFYNTGIATYIWVVTNRKRKERKGKIQLINSNGEKFYCKMTPSLGNKRNYIDDNQIDQISKLYGEFTENEFCKIYDNNEFGFWRITVERPLRLNFQISEERINNLKEELGFINLAKSKKKGEAGLKEIEEGELLQNSILELLNKNVSENLCKNRDEFTSFITNLFEKAELKLNSTIQKLLLSALSEKDETAEICKDKNGNSEPDTDLRDFENVPLKDNIEEYFKREVLPHVPDAWIDETKTKIGYEINFTKYFYVYKPLRNLEDIKQDLLKLETESENLLKDILN